MTIFMKKHTLVFFALSAIACATTAQTTATLYGLVDAAIYKSSNTAGASQLQLTSGMMEGSRWGIRGTEDLGGGMRATFTLENRFEVDTGAVGNTPISGAALPARVTRGLTAGQLGAIAPVLAGIGPRQAVNGNGALFDRQAFVGLITPVGAFLAGRQYTPAFATLAKYDASATQGPAASGGLGMLFYQPVEIRRSNSLMYVIQQSGVSASLMHAFGEAKTATAPGSSGSLTGVNLSYDAGPISVGIAHNAAKDGVGQSSLKTTVVGGSYNFGAAKLFGTYAKIDDMNPALATTIATLSAPAAALLKPNLIQDASLIHLGVSFDVGTGTVKLGYNQLNDKRAANADSTSYGGTYTYPLSKRTNLNFALARVTNKNFGQVALGGGGFSGGITSAPGVDSTSIGFGLRHSF
jgi:predicted porin